MTGHFENGEWIEDPDGFRALHMKIEVDTSQIDELNARLEEMRDLFAVPESMTTIWQRLRWLITGKVKS